MMRTSPDLKYIQDCLEEKKTSELIAFLEREPEAMSIRGAEKEPLLSMAVRFGNLVLIQWLIEKGVDLLATNEEGWTALTLALTLRKGQITARLYYYEQQIPENPNQVENWRNLEQFYAPPDPEIMSHAAHKSRITAFQNEMAYLNVHSESFVLPAPTLTLTLSKREQALFDVDVSEEDARLLHGM